MKNLEKQLEMLERENLFNMLIKYHNKKLNNEIKNIKINFNVVSLLMPF